MQSEKRGCQWERSKGELFLYFSSSSVLTWSWFLSTSICFSCSVLLYCIPGILSTYSLALSNLFFNSVIFWLTSWESLSILKWKRINFKIELGCPNGTNTHWGNLFSIHTLQVFYPNIMRAYPGLRGVCVWSFMIVGIEGMQLCNHFSNQYIVTLTSGPENIKSTSPTH